LERRLLVAEGLSVTEKISGIERNAVDPDFVVELRPRATAGSPHLADHFASPHILADLHLNLIEVTVSCDDTVAMAEDDHLAVVRIRPYRSHKTGSRSDNRSVQ